MSSGLAAGGGMEGEMRDGAGSHLDQATHNE